MSEFVRSVDAGRRRIVTNAVGGEDPNAGFRSRFVGELTAGCAVCASACCLIGSAGMLRRDISWGYFCRWTLILYWGNVVWTLCAVITGVRAGKSGRLVPVTSQLNALALVGLTVVASLTLWYSENFQGANAANIKQVISVKAEAICSTVFGSILLLSAVLHHIHFRTFSGLYAPVWPLKEAPTIIPLFPVMTFAAAFYCTSAGLQFQPQNLFVLRIINSCRMLAWLCWFIQAYSRCTIMYVLRQLSFGPQQESCTPLTRHSESSSAAARK